MNNIKINFKLQELDKIVPWGKKPNLGLHWFGLTDALLWINIGGQTIYEYTQEDQDYFGTSIRYNNYYLSRFLEDFFGTFYYIRESIPFELYNNIEEFYREAYNWKENFPDDDGDIFDRFFEEKYVPLTTWYDERTFDSGHLVGGPLIGCFRYNERIKIVWKSDYKLESGNSIWTSPEGVFELCYNDFVLAVSEFLDSFFAAMDKQVEKAVAKDWGEITLDKKRLIMENEERKDAFSLQLSYLRKNSPNNSDWEKIIAIFREMRRVT